MKTSLFAVAIAILVTGCTTPSGSTMNTVAFVDLDQFMGDWYVIAGIPTFIEKDAQAPIEKYERTAENTVATTFEYLDENGKKRSMQATGFVTADPSNAKWKMQFIWPLRMDYRIVYLDETYQTTIVAREKRDYLWIMAREYPLSEPDLDKLITFAEGIGYKADEIQLYSWQETAPQVVNQ